MNIGAAVQRETVTLRQFAARLGVHEKTVRRKLKAGLLPIRPLPRFTLQYLFYKGDVDRLIAGQIRYSGKR